MNYIRACNEQLAVCSGQQAAKHSERGRLTGAIRSEQTKDGAAVQFKTDVVAGREVTKLPGQVVNVYDDFVVSRGQRAIEGDSRGVFLIGHAAQQRHEAVLESRCY